MNVTCPTCGAPAIPEDRPAVPVQVYPHAHGWRYVPDVEIRRRVEALTNEDLRRLRQVLANAGGAPAPDYDAHPPLRAALLRALGVDP